MANIFLTENETLGPLGGEQTIFGSTGNETVLLEQGANFTIDAITERVELPGKVEDFTFQTVGTGVEIKNASNGDLVATFNDLDNSPTVIFSNGSTSLTAPTTVGDPAQIGGTDIPTDSSTSVTPTNIESPDAPILNPDEDNILNGTEGDDSLDGGLGADTIFGSIGNDTLNGGDTLTGADNRDELNYSELDAPIQITPPNLVVKGVDGELGTDEIVGLFEVIVADADFSDAATVQQVNTIDGNNVTQQNATIDIDLSSDPGSLQLNLDSMNPPPIDIENFVDVFGTGNSDTIVGDDKDNTINGNDGNDRLRGGNGDDTLIGGNNGAATVTEAEIAIVKSGTIEDSDEVSVDIGTLGTATATFSGEQDASGVATELANAISDLSDSVTANANSEIITVTSADGQTNIAPMNLSETDANNSFDISESTIANIQQTSAAGSDELTGGNGNDDFLFAEDGDFGDTITDFNQTGNDQIGFEIGSAGMQTGAMTGGIVTPIQTGTSNASITSNPVGNGVLQSGTGDGNTGVALRVAAANLSGVLLPFLSANNTTLSVPSGAIFQGSTFTSASNLSQFASLINNATAGSNFTNSNVPVNSGIFGAIALTNGGTNLVGAVIDNPSGTVSAEEITLQTLIASFSGGNPALENGDLFLI